MKQKVIQIGNSLGVIIPSNEVKRLKLEKGKEVEVAFGGSADRVSEPKAQYQTSKSDPDAKFMKSLERVNSRYKDALTELANR